MFNTIIATYKKNRATTKRAYPWSFTWSRFVMGAFNLLFPILTFYWVFHGQLSTSFLAHYGSNDYVSYIFAGVSLNMLTFSIMINVGRSFLTEIREGTVDNLFLSPASRIGYLIGSYLEQYTRALLQFCLLTVVAFLFGMRLSWESIPVLITVLILASISAFPIAILLAAIMVFTRDSYICQNTIYMVFSLICGISFPTIYLPAPIQAISNLFPLTHAVNLFRNCVFLEKSLYENLGSLAFLVVVSIVITATSILWIGKLEKKIIDGVFA